MGSFRLTAGTPHLHGEFNFTESMLETAGKVVTPFVQVGTYPTRNFATLDVIVTAAVYRASIQSLHLSS